MTAMIIICALFVIVGMLAARYGHDGREGIASKEAELAAYGMTWDDRTNEQLAQELAAELRLAGQWRRTTNPVQTPGRQPASPTTGRSMHAMH